MSADQVGLRNQSLRLIVNADDFGITDAASSTIVDCHRSGNVTSTTLMTNMPGAEFAAGIARNVPTLGIGLHFNLTSGRPLSPAGLVPSLVDANGLFFSRARLLLRLASGSIRDTDLQREFQAQIGRMQELGLAPTHLDSHQHVHSVPRVFSLLAAAARQRGVALRVPLSWPGRVAGKSWVRRGSEFALGLMVARCRRRIPPGLAVNDGFCSIFDLNRLPSEISARDYETLIDAYAGGVVELMVHPAAADDELRAATSIAEVSSVEAELLKSPFIERIASVRGGRLATYRDAFL